MYRTHPDIDSNSMLHHITLCYTISACETRGIEAIEGCIGEAIHKLQTGLLEFVVKYVRTKFQYIPSL